MRQQESIPVPRGWTGGAAWKGAGASLLLHLFVGAAVIVALSGPQKEAPRVVDLTLLPPAEIDRRPVPPAFAAKTEPATDPGTAVLPEPPALPVSQAVAIPPDGTAPTNPSAPGSPLAPAAASATTGQGQGKGPAVRAGAGSPSGTSGAESQAGGFIWIRDAIQHAIAYPQAARRNGWEGKVVVAFRLLSDGSVRDVRIVQGSGHPVLDRGAIDAVRNASPFPRSPVDAEVITPVVYRLTTR